MVLLSSLSTGYASSEPQSKTFDANAAISSNFALPKSLRTFCCPRLVEFRCQICQIEEDQLDGSCATCMPEKDPQ